jgi:F0F1-type ATP synthase membrane subunit b/b'
MAESTVNIPAGELQTQALAGAEPQQEASLLTINGTLPFIALSFVLFAIVMQKIFYAPMTKIRQKRADYIKDIKTEAQQAFEQAQALQAEYNEKIKTARKTVSEETAMSMGEANQEKTRILDEKKQDVERFLEENRQKILQEHNEALESLKGSIAEYAFDISKKVLEDDVPVIVVSQEAIDNAVKNS